MHSGPTSKIEEVPSLLCALGRKVSSPSKHGITFFPELDFWPYEKRSSNVGNILLENILLSLFHAQPGSSGDNSHECKGLLATAVIPRSTL